MSEDIEASHPDGPDDHSSGRFPVWSVFLLSLGVVVLAAIGWAIIPDRQASKASSTSETNRSSTKGSSTSRTEASDEASNRLKRDPDAEVLEAAEKFYQSRPYYQQPVGHLEVPRGLPDLEAETCGGCHTEIYEEWSISTHRRAWKQDAQFMAELRKSRGAADHGSSEGDDVGWMCVTCHTPVTNQLERVVVGLRNDDIGQPIYRDNPSYNPRLQEEAITCATCHVRNGKVYGPYGDTNAPHPTAKDPTLRDSSTCTECHQAEAHWPSRSLACFFSTGEEWRASSYAENGTTCQSCHMPTVERKLAEGFDRPKRKTRRHWFGGSLIPKHPKYTEEIQQLQEVYGSGANVELIRADRANDVNLAENGTLEASECPSESGCRQYIVRVTNAHAGHHLPTGDPERHLDITATVKAPDRGVVSRAKQRIASKYKWWPNIRELYDNRIPANGHLDFKIHVPRGTNPYTVDISAHKYRMYQEAFDYHDLEGEYVRGRRFHHSVWNIGEDGAITRTLRVNDKHPTPAETTDTE